MFLSVCMYICMYICMYVCMYVYQDLRICMYVYMYVCIFMYVCMRFCIYSVFADTYAYIPGICKGSSLSSTSYSHREDAVVYIICSRLGSILRCICIYVICRHMCPSCICSWASTYDSHDSLLSIVYIIFSRYHT